MLRLHESQSKALLLLLVFGTFCARVKSRSWEELDVVHYTAQPDAGGLAYLVAEEKVLFLPDKEWKELMTNRSSVEHMPSTNQPSPAPSSSPSQSPSSLPSTKPTPGPTIAPTSDPFAAAAEPVRPPTSYFSYNIDSAYGPNRWGQVGLPGNNYYWDEFGSPGSGPWKGNLAGHDLHRNFCQRGTAQSPIDLHHRKGAICHDFHEVRSLRGDFSVSGANVERLIQKNKLRLKYRRRPCADVLNNPRCREPDPPQADFPNGWPGMADVLNIDFKIPSEHTVRGQRFDAEMQIFHLHAGNRRIATQSVLITAKPDGYNYYFQEALNAFGREYEKNRSGCRRRLSQDEDIDLADLINTTSSRTLEEFKGGAWDPHHKMLIPTIHFYRYEGSLTEPPCTEFVTWFVADKPMIISSEQLELMKVMLFTNVNPHNCKKSGVHFGRSVARPIQALNDRGVYQCTPGDFGPDP